MASGWHGKGWYVLHKDCWTIQCKPLGHCSIEAAREPNQECKRTEKGQESLWKRFQKKRPSTGVNNNNFYPISALSATTWYSIPYGNVPIKAWLFCGILSVEDALARNFVLLRRLLRVRLLNAPVDNPWDGISGRGRECTDWIKVVIVDSSWWPRPRMETEKHSISTGTYCVHNCIWWSWCYCLGMLFSKL
jgi:hypothetical protein